MAGEEDDGFPKLSKNEIEKIKYIFLTHSHADHTGALPWIIKNGFSGQIVATKETLQQLSFQLEDTLTLEEYQKQEQSLRMEYGRSGHCVGSVWYRFECEDKAVFFSGDYVEKNFVHEIDLIREKKADLAVIDCAYGTDKMNFSQYCSELVKNICKMKQSYQTILLPVPKYGRGIEIYWLLRKHFTTWKFSADSHFVKQFLEIQNGNWIRKNVILQGDVSLYMEGEKPDVVFVSDPQLKSPEARMIAEQVLEFGHGIMTGTTEKGTMSAKLIEAEKMTMLRFPVHLNYSQFCRVAANNTFKNVVIYHSKEFDCEKIFEV